MKFKFFITITFITLLACNHGNRKGALVVFPDYCGGCVSKNFLAIHENKLNDELNVYFDTTDSFVLNEAKRNQLSFVHMNNKDIPAKFGDFSNIVIINLKGEAIELSTNQVIEKGKNF